MSLNWRRFFSRKLNLLALLILVVFVATAVAASWLAPPDNPESPVPFKFVGDTFQAGLPQPPTPEHLLGITSNHQDIFYTLIWGTRSALRFGLTATLVTAGFGIVVGAIGGYIGGILEKIILRITDAFLTFPTIAAVWLFRRALFPSLFSEATAVTTAEITPFQSFIYSLELDPILLALIFFSWMPYARIINAVVSKLRHSEFVEAARAMGASTFRILFRHILPNAISPAIVLASRDIARMVILAAAFTFIGLGGNNVAWGAILASERAYVIGISGNPFAYWWTFVPISLAIVLYGIGWNLLGDGLNELLNPRAV
ncbi:MAG: ABC transporter permease [Chloroflexota bacterium]